MKLFVALSFVAGASAVFDPSRAPLLVSNQQASWTNQNGGPVFFLQEGSSCVPGTNSLYPCISGTACVSSATDDLTTCQCDQANLPARQNTDCTNKGGDCDYILWNGICVTCSTPTPTQRSKTFTKQLFDTLTTPDVEWCPEVEACVPTTEAENVCAGKCDSEEAQGSQEDCKDCYCDEECDNKYNDCCPGWESACTDESDEDQIASTLCGAVDQVTSKFCQGHVAAQTFRKAFGLEIDDCDGERDNEYRFKADQTNNDSGRCLKIDRGYWEFACAGQSNTIVVKKCDSDDCNDCDDDWQQFEEGSVEAGKCWQSGTRRSGYIFFCDYTHDKIEGAWESAENN